jgi:Na+/H+ antiporter NhaD/arsenite permease-like protein
MDYNRRMAKHGVIHVGHPDAHVPGYEIAEGVAPKPSTGALVAVAIIGVIAAFVGEQLHHWAETRQTPTVAAYWMIPFAVLLGAIAVMPFIAKHFWEHHYAKVAIALGLIVGVYYVTGQGVDGRKALAASVAEYISFILLIGSLFIVSGGILIRVRARATPAANTSLLLIGAIIANIFGTAGASMLLIRPFLRMNNGHVRAYHVVFFIFVVSNAGGSLTPIGDPPLFLGFLQGVPFWWVLEHCWPFWLAIVLPLLVIFFVVDTLSNKRDNRQPYAGEDEGASVSIYGASNLIFVALIIAGILLHAPINAMIKPVLHLSLPIREMAMIFAVVASLGLTPRRVHVENQFNYAPIKEVAYLFIGIFLAMVPALNYLYHQASNPQSNLRLNTPGQFYYASGTLSAVLDNAPTYLTFLQSKLGQLDKETVARAVKIGKSPGSEVTEADLAGLSEANQQSLRETIDALKKYHPDRLESGNVTEAEVRVGFLVGDHHLNINLIAISMGSVLFGAMTYIGNGPNFMVKSIAEHSGVPVPSFFGYVFKYSIPILLPLLIVAWWLFLSGPH